MFGRIFVVVAALLMSTSAFAANRKPQNCVPTSRTKPVPVAPDPHRILRGDGISALDLYGITFSITEERYADCRIASSYRFEYTQYNHFQRGNGYNPAQPTVTLTMMSGGRVLDQNFLTVAPSFGFCGPYGTPGQHGGFVGRLGRNLFDTVDQIVLTSDRVSGKMGKC
ncbi:hypothetical protein QY049_37445 [Bradyrhizobium sp. WYCCWR 13022]|uniref:hypothetical protein n=1 Tax=unclassified Bradyrhizobium TaxID=2631580 RepID=UPI00263BD865|nr:hypothetical protein [Bradyrhizobium sp. WYCCWR 13022]MDN4988834.1 hypothetical protein [Bradyrhizobium sp. WYCCWR 13022]